MEVDPPSRRSIGGRLEARWRRNFHWTAALNSSHPIAKFKLISSTTKGRLPSRNDKRLPRLCLAIKLRVSIVILPPPQWAQPQTNSYHQILSASTTGVATCNPRPVHHKANQDIQFTRILLREELEIPNFVFKLGTWVLGFQGHPQHLPDVSRGPRDEIEDSIQSRLSSFSRRVR
jgi:hypothetical protein